VHWLGRRHNLDDFPFPPSLANLVTFDDDPRTHLRLHGHLLQANSRQRSTTEQRELRHQAKVGRDATEEFLKANLRLVVSIAKKYQASGVPLLDLIQEGNLGLMHAVEKFDWRRGFNSLPMRAGGYARPSLEASATPAARSASPSTSLTR
jgi:sigma-70-like protein